MMTGKRINTLIFIILSCLLLTGCADSSQDTKYEQITSYYELEGKIFGCVTGSISRNKILEDYPDSEILFYDSRADMYNAMLSRKTDAIVTEKSLAATETRKTEGVYITDENIKDSNYAIVMHKDNTELLEEFNRTIAKYREDGTMDRLADKWIWSGNNDQELEVRNNVENPKDVLIVYIDAGTQGFDYIKNNEYVGYEIELLNIICNELGYGTEIHDVNFPSLLNAVSSGTADIAMGGITITEERKKAVAMTDPVFMIT